MKLVNETDIGLSLEELVATTPTRLDDVALPTIKRVLSEYLPAVFDKVNEKTYPYHKITLVVD